MVQILREETIKLRDMGCDFIQYDEPILMQVVLGEESSETFMCASLPQRRDPTTELEFALRIMNEVAEGHRRRQAGRPRVPGQLEPQGRGCCSPATTGPLLPYLVQMNVDQLVLECATPRAGEMEVFKEYA